MPLSILEAFACGLPVVSTNVGGVSTILSDGVHGLLAPDNDAESVAACIIELVEQPDRARRLAAAGRDSCARYEWRQVREAWLTAYRQLAGARPAVQSVGLQDPA
jgi:phenylacetate-CoA ligase